MRYEHIVTEVFHKPWAILPETFSVISQMISLRVRGERLTEQQIREALAPSRAAAAARVSARSSGAIAVIPIRGVISNRSGLMSNISGGTSIEKLRSSFRSAMADPGVSAILFDVDSPGGPVEGVPEMADEIYRARGQKKIAAIANGMAASAAYWLASAASDLSVVPSGQAGSIGVFTSHEDVSKMMEQAGVKVSFVSAGKYKTEGNEYEPLSDEARAALQEKVNAFYGMFVKAVARGRGATQKDVTEGFGQGRMLLAADAVKEGMADRVATMDEALARLGAPENARMAAMAASVIDEHDDDGDDDGDMCECACAACMDGNCSQCVDPQCADEMCKGAGCQTQAKAQASAQKNAEAAAARGDIERRRREIDLT